MSEVYNLLLGSRLEFSQVVRVFGWLKWWYLVGYRCWALRFINRAHQLSAVQRIVQSMDDGVSHASPPFQYLLPITDKHELNWTTYIGEGGKRRVGKLSFNGCLWARHDTPCLSLQHQRGRGRRIGSTSAACTGWKGPGESRVTWDLVKKKKDKSNRNVNLFQHRLCHCLDHRVPCVSLSVLSCKAGALSRASTCDLGLLCDNCCPPDMSSLILCYVSQVSSRNSPRSLSGSLFWAYMGQGSLEKQNG